VHVSWETQVSDPGGKGGYTAVQFHPDGLLAGLGTSDGSIQVRAPAGAQLALNIGTSSRCRALRRQPPFVFARAWW
jgi:hypothetical protein